MVHDLHDASLHVGLEMKQELSKTNIITTDSASTANITVKGTSLERVEKHVFSTITTSASYQSFPTELKLEYDKPYPPETITQRAMERRLVGVTLIDHKINKWLRKQCK